ncbi:MAG: hypothetical protein ABI700_04220 [Chloroflexota bacterium]
MQTIRAGYRVVSLVCCLILMGIVIISKGSAHDISNDDLLAQINKYSIAGAQYMESHDYDEAVASFSAAYDLTFDLKISNRQEITDGFAPTLANALRLRGNERYGSQDTEGAIADFTRAIELDPRPLDDYDLAISYRRLAVTVYRQADAFGSDANLQIMISNFEPAIANYKLLLEHAPDPGSHVDASVIDDAQKSLDAFQELLEAIQAIYNKTFEACSVTTLENASIYANETTFESGNTPVGTLPNSQKITLRGVDGDWWLIDDGHWIRSESIAFGKECRQLPLALPDGGLLYPPGSPLTDKATENAAGLLNNQTTPTVSVNFTPVPPTPTALPTQPAVNANDIQDAASVFALGMSAQQQHDAPRDHLVSRRRADARPHGSAALRQLP